jgi:hypothetical protein
MGSLFTVVPQNNPPVLSEEVWFKTTTTRGGALIGFCSHEFDNSCDQADHQLYMTNTGQLILGTSGGSIQSTSSYNDGQWHYAAGISSNGALTLYVDGAAIGTALGKEQSFLGYWHIGFNSLNGWPSAPQSNGIAASLGEAAIYNYPLSANQVSKHFGQAKTGNYDSAVLADSPAFYWKFSETSGLTFGDATGGGNTAISQAPSNNGFYLGSEIFAQPGIISTDNAVLLDGSTGFISGPIAVTSPAPFSEEIWFNTTTALGGEMIGLCDHLLDNSCSSTDRHLYMINTGQIIFATFNASVQTTNSYNDGKWHHAVATWAANTLGLYIDGALIGTASGGLLNITAYWHIGANKLSFWPSPPSSFYLAGTIDEPAIYNYALTATEVANHYHASGR